MSTENPFGNPPAPKSEVSPDTSYVDMAEGNPAEAGENVPTEASLQESETKFTVSTEPPAPSAENVAELAAVQERLGIKGVESTASELTSLSEEELQTMTSEQLREFTKQAHAENRVLEQEKAVKWNSLLENIRGPIKEQLEARLAEGDFSDYREKGTIESTLSNMDTPFLFSSDIQRYWQGGASLINSETDIMPLLSDDVKDQIAAFYAQEEEAEEKHKPMSESWSTANRILREREKEAA